MSTFKTNIPVDVEGVRRLLPKDSFVESVEWNAFTRQVEVIWSNRNCVTPFSVPVEWSVQMLHDKTLPKGAAIREPSPVATPQESIVTVNVKPVDKRGRKSKSALP